MLRKKKRAGIFLIFMADLSATTGAILRGHFVPSKPARRVGLAPRSSIRPLHVLLRHLWRHRQTRLRLVTDYVILVFILASSRYYFRSSSYHIKPQNTRKPLLIT